MSIKKYEQLIVQSWDIQKVSQLIMEKIPFEELIFDKTDILLEIILRNEFILFKRLLNRGFPVKESKFNYLIPILNNYIEDKKKYVDLLFQYVDPKEYINRKSIMTQENSLSIVTQQNNQDMIVQLSKMGGDWNSCNNLNQTPLHFLLRNHTSFIQDLIEELERHTMQLDKKDDFGITVKDIIKSLIIVPEWLEKNKKLLEVIKYENWQ